MILSHQTACSGQCAHDRAVELSSPRNLCVLSASALDSSFFEASRIAKSNLLIFFRTLLHSSKSQLLSFQANPNSFPKTPGGGVPPPPLSAFVPCVLYDLCGEIFFCSVPSSSPLVCPERVQRGVTRLFRAESRGHFPPSSPRGSAVGVPLFFDGKRPLSFFSLYRCRTLPSKRGGVCTPPSPSFSTRFKNEPDKDSPAIRLSTSLFFGKLSLAGKSKVHAFARRSTLLRGPGSKR